MSSNFEKGDFELVRLDDLHRQQEVIELFKVGRDIITTKVPGDSHEILIGASEDSASFILGLEAGDNSTILLTRRVHDTDPTVPIAQLTRQGQLTIESKAGDKPPMNSDSDIAFLQTHLPRLKVMTLEKSLELASTEQQRAEKLEYNRRTVLGIALAAVSTASLIGLLEANGARQDASEERDFDSYTYTIPGGTQGMIGETVNPALPKPEELEENIKLAVGNVPDLADSHRPFGSRNFSPADGLRQYVIHKSGDDLSFEDASGCETIPISDIDANTVVTAWTDYSYESIETDTVSEQIEVTLGEETLNICYDLTYAYGDPGNVRVLLDLSTDD